MIKLEQTWTEREPTDKAPGLVTLTIHQPGKPEAIVVQFQSEYPKGTAREAVHRIRETLVEMAKKRLSAETILTAGNTAPNVIAKPEHELAYKDIAALLDAQCQKHNLTALELLAVAANMVGKIIAAQDAQNLSEGQVMDVVIRNLQIGNQQAIQELAGKPN